MVRIIFLTLLSFQLSLSGFHRQGFGARSRAMGGASVGLSDDVWSAVLNPAALAQITAGDAGFFYSPQPFGLSELADIGVVAASGTPLGSVGIAVRRFGYSRYHEITGTLGYARVFENAGIGIAANFYSVSIERYGSASTIGFDIGMYVRLLEQFRWGVSVHNINTPSIGAARDKLPQSFLVGIAYLPHIRVRLPFDIQKETSYYPTPRFGFEYWPVDAVAFRAGYCDEQSEISSGLGIRIFSFQFDYAIVHHQELGWTQIGSVLLRFGGSDE